MKVFHSVCSLQVITPAKGRALTSLLQLFGGGQRPIDLTDTSHPAEDSRQTRAIRECYINSDNILCFSAESPKRDSA